MIIDAGGGTIDLSTYQFLSENPISMEEIAPAGCERICLSIHSVLSLRHFHSGILQGSTTVNVRAQEFLESMFIFHRTKLNSQVRL